jgi:hypothetical protein
VNDARLLAKFSAVIGLKTVNSPLEDEVHSSSLSNSEESEPLSDMTIVYGNDPYQKEKPFDIDQ